MEFNTTLPLATNLKDAQWASEYAILQHTHDPHIPLSYPFLDLLSIKNITCFSNFYVMLELGQRFATAIPSSVVVTFRFLLTRRAQRDFDRKLFKLNY